MNRGGVYTVAVSAIKYVAMGCVVVGAAWIAKSIVMPRILRAVLGVKKGVGKPRDWQDRVELRYEKMDTSIWMFAWFKLRLDPMFKELPKILVPLPKIRTALDLGCGYGVAGSSFLEWNEDLRLYGIDPNPKRTVAAARAFGERGEVFQGGAPEFEVPRLPGRFDAVFILDVIHYLPDAALDLTLRRIRARLDEGGYLLIRAPMPPDGAGSLPWKAAKLRRLLTGAFACYRTVEQISEAIVKAGFDISRTEVSGKNGELRWFLAIASSTDSVSASGPESKLADSAQHEENN